MIIGGGVCRLHICRTLKPTDQCLQMGGLPTGQRDAGGGWSTAASNHALSEREVWEGSTAVASMAYNPMVLEQAAHRQGLRFFNDELATISLIGARLP